jgi:predicted negative regulator of RcsB-dependent stress response
MSADLKESSTPLAEISQAPNAFEQFLDRNQKGILVLAVLLVVFAAAAVVYQGIQTSQTQTLGNALNKAEDPAALQAVVDSNPSSTAAGSAMLLLANSKWTAGNQDDAIATLRKFIETYPSHPGRYTAKASLGAKLLAQGKSGDAAPCFEELVDDSAAAFIAPFALISLGDIAKNGGDLEKAKTYYTKVQKFTDSSFTSLATARLATLTTTSPSEIEPPPAPPETPSTNPPAPSPITVDPPAVQQP